MIVGIEIKLPKPENFLMIVETLTRIGMLSADGKTLVQSVHILHKQGRYYILHFKELFVLGGRTANITKEDLLRRNDVVGLLVNWGLCDPIEAYEMSGRIGNVFVVPFHDKHKYTLVQKYQMGKKKQQ